MVAAARPLAIDSDQRVTLYAVPWSHYEIMLAIRGDDSVPRISYLEGTLELMSPSHGHEGVKTMFARLVEAYADELGIRINGFGSWTLRNAPKALGAEPDECYIRGPAKNRDTPDLAIEVVWTSGGIDKLEIYRGLGVREVWFWESHSIRVFELEGGSYSERNASAVLPELDLKLISRLIDEHEDQFEAVAALRKTLRAPQ